MNEMLISFIATMVATTFGVYLAIYLQQRKEQQQTNKKLDQALLSLKTELQSHRRELENSQPTLVKIQAVIDKTLEGEKYAPDYRIEVTKPVLDQTAFEMFKLSQMIVEIPFDDAESISKYFRLINIYQEFEQKFLNELLTGAVQSQSDDEKIVQQYMRNLSINLQPVHQTVKQLLISNEELLIQLNSKSD